MGWELTIYGDVERPPRPVGNREQVCAHFAARLPGVKLAPEPQAFADHMTAKLKEQGVGYHPTLVGYHETPEFVIEFSCTDAEIISDISANVRWSGNPLPVFRSLCAGTSWVVVEDASGEDLLAAADPSSGWRRFKQWRDRSMSMLSESEDADA